MSYMERVMAHQRSHDWWAQAHRLMDRIPGGVKGKRVLDFGCGPGALSYLLWLNGADVVGVDLPEMVSLARRKHSRGPQFEYDVIGRYDVVVASHVLGHVPNVQETLDDLVRWTLPRGNIVVLNPNVWNTVARAPANKLKGYKGDPTLTHHFSLGWLDSEMAARDQMLVESWRCGERWSRLPKFISMPLFGAVYRDIRYDC